MPLATWQLYEAEVLEGLASLASDELARRFKGRAVLLDSAPTALQFRFDGPPAALHAWRTVVALYHLDHYSIPRPKALLGHQHFTRLTERVQQVLDAHPPDAFQTFRFSAAGKDSRVFMRLKDDLQSATGLRNAPDEADLLMRVRPAQTQPQGWEVLTRTTPRPLATRDWRVCDQPGALNATIAAGMVALSQPAADTPFLNLMSGTGTLLIECALDDESGPAGLLLGVEHDPATLACAHHNLTAAGLSEAVHLVRGDVTALPLPAGSVAALVVDLPWGQHVGSHDENLHLYPRTLAEAARVTRPGGRLVVLSHEVNLMAEVLAEQATVWAVQQEIRVFQGGLHPRLYVLLRTGQSA